MGSVLAHRDRLPDLHFSPQFLREEFAFGLRYREHHDGQLPGTPFWRYLEARYDLDPARFTHWHPRVGHWIHEAHHPGQGMSPSRPSTGQPSPPPEGSQSLVPEPGSGLLFGIGLIIVFACKEVRRGRISR